MKNLKKYLFAVILGSIIGIKWYRINNCHTDSTFSTKEIIQKKGLVSFLKTRFITPKEIAVAIKDIKENYGGLQYFSLEDFIWHARYINFKAIEGYDFD